MLTCGPAPPRSARITTKGVMKTRVTMTSRARKSRTRQPARMPLGPRKMVSGGGGAGVGGSAGCGGKDICESAIVAAPFRTRGLFYRDYPMCPGEISGFVPEGHLRVARRFNAGTGAKRWNCVPEERLKRHAMRVFQSCL